MSDRMLTKNRFIKQLGGVLILGVAVAFALWIGTQNSSRSAQALQASPLSIAWVGKSWTADDTRFVSIRKKIDRQIAEGQAPEALLARYREEAQASPTDPRQVFAWGYSAQKALRPSLSVEAKDEIRAGVQQALLAVPFPNTYNYARMLFLMSEVDLRLVSSGERLLVRDPNDNEVKVKLINNYDSLIAVEGVKTNHVDTNAEQRALLLVDQLIHADPKNPVYHGMQASLYISAFYAGEFKNPEDGRKAIAADQEYLRLGPPNPDSIRIAKGEIEEMQGKLNSAAK